MRPSRWAVATMVAGMWVSLTHDVPPAHALDGPSVDAVMEELHLSDGDRQRILGGEIVEWSAGEGSDRELAIGLAFLVKAPPKNLAEIYRQAVSFDKVPVITAHGQIVGEGTIDDFAHLTLQPNPEKEARRYLNAQPGNELNLDAHEIAAFRALKASSHDGVPVQKVEGLIREMLLARYQAYRTKGLPGIAPYERGDGRQRRPGDELLLSTKELLGIARHAPAFHNFLLNYPHTLTAEQAKHVEEYFYWLNIDVFGRPTYVLMHRMLAHVGTAGVAVERQYYAGHDYNCMLQGIAGLPTKEGMFLFYIGRVSTDQVGGFGSSAKHPIARTIAAPYIKDTFKILQSGKPEP